MNCNRCQKSVDEETILHFDTLAPMTGYNYMPDEARCVACCRPVCKSCMYGLGMFMFACREECQPAWQKYIEDGRYPHPRIKIAMCMLDRGISPEDVAHQLGIKNVNAMAKQIEEGRKKEEKIKIYEHRRLSDIENGRPSDISSHPSG